MLRRLWQMSIVALWIGVLVAFWFSVNWGRNLQRSAPEIFLGAAPLVGRNFRDGWDWRFGWGLIAAGAIGVVVVAGVATDWFLRARLRVVVSMTSLLAGAFALALALTDGKDGVLFGAADENEYLANLPTAPPAGEFVRTFVDRIDDYTVHVRGHPPGFVVLLKLIDALGLHGAWPVAMLSLISTMIVPAAVLVTVWAVAGHTWVRRSAPFLIVTPYALWMMTSADAFYTALGASGVALVALAMNQRGRDALLLGAGGGLLLSTLLFMTYGAAIYTLVPVTLVIAGWVTKRPGTTRAVIAAIGAALVVTVGWRLAGFWWFDGAEATRGEYWEGTAQFRIWNYFIFANLVAALFAVGPATFVGLTKLKHRPLWILVGGSLLAVFAADMSQLSKGEVERIWLVFYPWLVIAGAALATAPNFQLRLLGGRRFALPRRLIDADRNVTRRVTWAGWVAVQAGCAIALQAALVSKW